MTEQTLQETVARAIYDVTRRWVAPNFPDGHPLTTFDELSDQERQLNLEYADAAIAAVYLAGETVLEQSETLDGRLAQTVQLPDGSETVRLVGESRKNSRTAAEREAKYLEFRRNFPRD